MVIFCLVQFSFLGTAGTGEILGPKFAERDPFIQWLPNFQDLNFGHGIGSTFLVLETFLGPKIRTSLTLRPFYTDI